MLHSLYIRDYILIKELTCTFPTGLIAVTGETGAGKSIFVSALQLLAGGRADMSTIRQGCAKAVIEGEFTQLSPQVLEWMQAQELEVEESCLVRREIRQTGRSRIFVNDTPVTLAQLEELGALLLDVHSQHRNLLLREGAYQIALIDSQLGAEADLVEAYHRSYQRYHDNAIRLKKLRTEAQQAEAEYEINSRAYEEISALKLEQHSLTDLTDEAERLTHTQEIQEGLQSILALLNRPHSIVDQLTTAQEQMEQTAAYLPELSNYTERMRSLVIELDDIESDLSRLQGEVAYNPSRLEEINTILGGVNALLKKHNLLSPEELIEYSQELGAKLAHTAQYEQELAELRTEVLQQRTEVLTLGKQLHEARAKAAKTIARSVTETLCQLEMPHARFDIALQLLDKPTERGMDQVDFLLSANSDQPLRPVTDIASGGEIARLMLALKALRSQATTSSAELASSPAIVFDEIDTGTSGIAASRIGDMLHTMGERQQIFVITHLPQIASAATQHILIYKEETNGETHSHLRLLTPEERISEIARLQSGDQITPEAIAAAHTLLTAHD